MRRNVRGVAKTLALFVVLTALAVGVASIDQVDGPSGVFLGFVYGMIAGYAAVIIGIVRDWVIP